MTEVLGEAPRTTAAGTTTATPSSTSGRHLGRYPLQLPRATDPRMHLAVVTTTLQVLGQTVFDFNVSIAQILITIATCAAIEFVVTFRRSAVIAWPASAMLTGNGIALILRVPGTEHGDWWSLRGWWVFVGAGVLAMASKYLIRVNGRHIFNPSNLALVVTFLVLGENLADPQVLWWGPLSVGLVIAFGVILAGSIVITRRVHQGHSTLSFWFVFAAATAVIAASGHQITANWHLGPIGGWDYWVLLVTSPEVLVFLFFMITDPKTAPSGRVGQTIFGSAIAVVGALTISTQSGEFGTKVGILAGLTVLCLFVRMIESRSPARISGADHVGRWLASLLAPPDSTPGVRVLRSAGALGSIVLLALALTWFGSNNSADAGDIPGLERRGEVTIDAGSLPDVEIDPDAIRTTVTLDQDLANRMGLGLAHSLELESLALEQGDAELAAAGLTGTRLAQTTEQIDDAETPPAATEHTYESLTATVIRRGGGPQSPPLLAVRATGETANAGAVEPFETTFILTEVGGEFLVTDALDSDGNPIGARPGQLPAIEPALEPTDPQATEAQLDGLAFEDVTAAVGLDLPHASSPLREGPSAWTGGAAAGDYDADGDPDVFLTRVGLPDALMRNDGGTFTDVTEAAGLMLSADEGSTGAMWVDLNGDSRLDLIVLGLGQTPNRLWLATPDERFEDATVDWRLPAEAPASADGAMFSLAAADYDGDGWVDLMLADSEPNGLLDRLPTTVDADAERCELPEAEVPVGTGTARSRTMLLRNTGTGLENRTDRLGFDPATLAAMTPRFADLDGDGWQDLLISGQLCSSKVLLNDGAGGFRDATEGSGIETVDSANGSELLDADGDGALDWFVTGVAYPTESGSCPLADPAASCSGNHLLLGRGDGTFTDATERFGLADGGWGWGAVASDFNLDGRTDLMMTNGLLGVRSTRPHDGSDPERPYFDRAAADADRLWLNVPDGRWPQGASASGLEGSGNGKATVPLDYDGDGLVDILVIDTDGPPTLHRNVTSNANRSLTVRLVDPDSRNTAAIGATVIARLTDGRSLSRRVSTDGSFQSGRGTEVHLGIGTASVDEFTVTWPDGTTQTVASPGTGSVTVERR